MTCQQTLYKNHLCTRPNALREQLEALIARHGYNGKRDLSKVYTQDEIETFQECLNLFLPISMEALFERDSASGKVIDIRWQEVKRALLHKLKANEYVTFTKVESSLIKRLLQKEHASFNDDALPILICNGYELAQCLEFFSAWSVKRKAAFVLAYLKSKSVKEQKEVLAILHNEKPNLQGMYFAIAIAEKDAAAVRTYVEHGADINQALPLLFSEAHKSGDTDIQQALNLELPNTTELWESLEKFRANFTQHSNQESVFNPQHLMHARV